MHRKERLRATPKGQAPVPAWTNRQVTLTAFPSMWNPPKPLGRFRESRLKTALRHYWYAAHLMDEQEQLEHARKLMETGDFESSLKAFGELGSAAKDLDSKFDSAYDELLSLIGLGKANEARQLLLVIPQNICGN
jgi:hypothetical protein